MRSGRLRQRIRIERRSSARDVAGERLPAWELVADVRAQIDGLSGSEILAASQRQGRVLTTFRLRYVEGVTPAMRVVVGSRVFNVIDAIPQRGIKRELVITAQELVETPP